MASIKDYAEFLNTLPFTHYGTFTTGYKMSLTSARRVMEGFHNQIRKEGQTNFFWVAENYEVNDGYHTHGLIQVPHTVTYKKLLDIWQHVSGGKKSDKWNRIDLQRYDKERGANFYVGKYIRRKNTDYDLLI
ncbi:MAG TPA: hypothetical protein VE978_13240 [Chitinophagales bacterium]|nr:hypothetical protein [Chitinophagales bacterium]